MKAIMIHFEDKEYEELKERKQGKTWKEFIMRK
jgi:hypothetical protein